MKSKEKEIQLNVKIKICFRCKAKKLKNDFHSDNSTKDKLKSSCKDCISKYNKKYNIINAKERRIHAKKWKAENADYAKKYTSAYQKLNKNHLYKKSTEYHNNRYNNDPIFKLRRLLRDRIYKTITNKKVTFKTREILGCSFEQLKYHIESQFKSEMNWSNHGIIWEVDHIKPISSFNLMDVEEQKQCFNYMNMQPLFKTTEIAESFGYMDEIGNRNKLNKYD
jgi:hypothetical protein